MEMSKVSCAICRQWNTNAEVFKLVPMIFNEFELELVDADKPLTEDCRYVKAFNSARALL
jgi:hypothetical protein